MFACGPADATASTKTSSSLATFKSGWFYLFWYRLIQVVLEKRYVGRTAVDLLAECRIDACCTIGAGGDGSGRHSGEAGGTTRERETRTPGEVEGSGEEGSVIIFQILSRSIETFVLLHFLQCNGCFHAFAAVGFNIMLCLQCFDAVGWAAGRASGL